MPAMLTQNSYGKSQVRLTRVTRHADRHDLKELSVGIQLEGDFARSYLDGDNSQVVATDLYEGLWQVNQGREGNPDVLQCGATIPWDYATAHTGQFGEQVEVTNGVLGELESGAAEAAICASQNSVACCQ